MYCLIGYVDSTLTVLEKSDGLVYFIGSIAEIIDVVDDMGTVYASF